MKGIRLFRITGTSVPLTKPLRRIWSLNFTAPVTVKNPGWRVVRSMTWTSPVNRDSCRRQTRSNTRGTPVNLEMWEPGGVREKDETNTRRSAKLSYISPLKTRYLFVDRQGKTTLDCSRADLARRFEFGRWSSSTFPKCHSVDRLTEGLVGKLGGAKPK
jgi:hypothetical protein